MARSDPNAQFERYQRQLARQLAREQEKAAAQAARDQEKEAKARHLAARRAEAGDRTAEAQERRASLDELLPRALTERVGPLDLMSLRRSDPEPVFDPGHAGLPLPPPRWSQFEPAAPGLLGRSLGRSRHERAVDEARAAFAAAQREHATAESARQAQLAELTTQHTARIAELASKVRAHNEELDRIAAGTSGRSRRAVSDYFDLVLGRIADPPDFPRARRAAYVPESEMLVIDWDLPQFGVVPTGRTFTYVQRADEIRETALPNRERRTIYQRLIASMALRAVWLVFRTDPARLVETVVVNGMIDQVDRATGQDVRRCLISLRATREKFEGIRIDRVDSVECVRRHFAAEVSEHPDELLAVDPVIAFDMADPRVIDPVDVLSEIDRRPNLLDLSGHEFEHFVQNLFTTMGMQVQVFRPGGDGGVDCVVYDPRPVLGGKFVVQAKRYARTVPPSAVRDLYGAVQHEGATKGLLITTGGFGQSSYAWVVGKPLHLMSGTELLGLCRAHDIPARIVHGR